MIDTAAKRRMAASFKPIWKVPIPDGTIDVNDRVHAGWAYGGIFVVLDLIDVLRRVSRGYTLGRVKPDPHNLGEMLKKYTLGG